jgi:hypothetical protein
MHDKPRLPASVQHPLDREREFLIAEPVQDEAEELRILPAEGPSREELSRQIEPPPPLDLRPAETRRPTQWSISDLLIVTTGLAVSFAGGTWMPPEVFAAVLGLVTMIGLLVVHLHPPESRLAKLVWGTLVLSYIIAVVTAVVRRW